MTPEEHWALFRADPRATPFQSPAWLDAWWTHLGGGGERIDAEARDGTGRLVAALPLFVWHDAGVRRLVPVGATQSDYLDALIDPACPDAAGRLSRAILDTADRWDELLLHNVRPDSPLLAALPGGPASDEPWAICPVLTLPPAPPLLPQLGKTQRRKVVHDRHRADALGGVTVGFAPPDEIDDALTALFELHAARWRLEGQEGALADPLVQAFHRAAAPALAAAGLLRLVVVLHGTRIVSVLLGLCDGRRGYSYVIGSDFAVAKQSFGTLAFAHLIESCLAEGAGEFHFLRGEEAYKYLWGAVARATVQRRVTRT